MRKKVIVSVALAGMFMAEAALGNDQDRPPVPEPQQVQPAGEAALPDPEPFPADFQVQRVMPEVSTAVTMSNSDINRITCPEEIRDVVFSKEKGVRVKTVGRDAFVKFLVRKKESSYSTTPTEFFVVCGENVYSIVALPKRVPSRTVRLEAGIQKIRENMKQYGALPYEKKILALIRSVYTNELPDGFTTRAANTSLPLFRDLEVTLFRTHRVDGEGLLVREFAIECKKEVKGQRLVEKDFLRPAIAARPVAISLDRQDLKQGDRARLIVVEKAASEGGADGAQGED